MAVILVHLNIQSSYDDPTVFRTSNRYLAAKLILLVILAFGYTVHVGFMDAVDLVLAVSLLTENLLKDRYFFFILLQPFRWEFSLKLP